MLIEATPAARLAFRLSTSTIRGLVPTATPGTYLLLAGNRPIYVGRSDHCLKTRLTGHNHRWHASHVLWETARTAWDAFLLESWWWHQHHDVLINKIHPASPTAVRCCPLCASSIDAGLTYALRTQHN